MKKILPLCFLIASIILMALPFGVAISYYSSPPDLETVTRYYSYFDTFTVGATGNVFPSMIAFFTIGLVIGYSIGLIRKTSVTKKSTIVLVGIILLLLPLASILSWVFFNSISVVGVIVFVLHVATFALLLIETKSKAFNKE